MTGSEVVEGRSDVHTLLLLPRTLLDERTEGSSTSSETGHDDRCRVHRGELEEEESE